MKRLTLLALLALSQAASAADEAKAPEIPIADFIKHEKFRDVKISPTGEYLAASIMTSEDTGGLVILRRSDNKTMGTMKLRGRTFVLDFNWVNDERVVLSVAEREGSVSPPRGTGEIYATNFDGEKQMLLVGGRQESKLTSNLSKRNFEGASFVDDLRDDDKHVLVEVYTVGSVDGVFPTLEKLDVYTGSRQLVARAPVLNAQFLSDRKGQVRFAWGESVDNMAKLYYRADDDAKWELINDEAQSGLRMQARGFNADGSKAYIDSEEAEGPNSLYLWDVTSHERKLLVRDDAVDPFRLFYTNDDRRPFAAVYMDRGPKVVLLDGKVPEAQTLKSLLGAFPGQYVRVRNYTHDGSECVFVVSSDTNPGEFYLLDKEHKAAFLMSSRDWLKPEQMAPMRGVTFKARDGLELHAYLTLPKGSDGKKLPLIVHPHGGPFGPFDQWGFDWEVQVNFRGSGNYGRKFERVGYQQWGGTMQDDLTDATKWAIAEGIADPKRIAIYGASYGAYASAMAIAKEPDLYQAAVGYVGVYDMGMMYTHGDIQESNYGQHFLKNALGTDATRLATASPTKLADRMKAPMFIISGGEDVRAPKEHSEALRKALKKAGHEPEWMLADHEGHGFFKEEVNLELYTRMLAFFDKYIGAGRRRAATRRRRGRPGTSRRLACDIGSVLIAAGRGAS